MTIPAPSTDGTNDNNDVVMSEERDRILPLVEATTTCTSSQRGPDQPTSIEGSHNGSGIERELEGYGEEGRGPESEQQPQQQQADYGDNFYAGGARGDAEERKTKHWMESPFAVGCVNATWQDDRPVGGWWWNSSNQQQEHAYREIDKTYPVTSVVCSCVGATRLGNLSVLSQSIEEYDDVEVNPINGEVLATHRKTRPRLLWVCGPYWTVNVFLTFPLILIVSGCVGYFKVFNGTPYAIQITWVLGTCFLLGSLAMISCRNPGILHRHSQPPPGTEEAEEWRWNDQARTYRPPKARFDPECQVVIEGFDHT
jgi:hypothetical protein